GTLIEAVCGGDAHAIVNQGEASPGRIADQLIVKPTVLGIENAVRCRVAAGQNLAAQGADLAGEAILDAELLSAQTSDAAFTELRLGELNQQAGDHPG